MRPPGTLVVALVLAAGHFPAQEPSGMAPLSTAADPPIASVPESSELLGPRPSLRRRLAGWRPINRWLNRMSAVQTQHPVAIPVAENPPQPAESTGGPARSFPAANPLEGETATTPGARSGSEVATAAGASGERRRSEAISGNPAAVNIITGTGALGEALGIDRDTGVRLGWGRSRNWSQFRSCRLSHHRS
jgi:hypothetical protein